ncbi:bacteriophage protein [Gluconacetobacter sacchari DSM 12717]|uniref:Baseplate J/gp47 family protein n=2 Tax=Gluconacetobacter sacchari TaxID=92759 RepID=A0A7W4IBB8_9PROT|nr:baseplate J/gp47 family protein [Gluconacetobacter sacchari]MBB2159736.1 baseplate J/gp47 family protein [Gluconacetobacter sacchari]GBQ23172.1 bacteriophage protein [Gluconacetobacter sacchari DSM 12717]
MPYARPTLTQLRQQAVQDVINGGIPGVVSLMRFSVLYVLAIVLAGLAWLHYGYIDWVSLQAVPWTATDEYLAGWAALKGVQQKAPTAATSTGISFVATDSNTIPAGTQISFVGGFVATVTADSVTVNGTTVANALMTTTGSVGNLPAGTIATLTAPVPGVQTTGTVIAAFTGGADIEDEDAFRARMLAAYQNGGTNGNVSDYVQWAKAVPGVTRAWVAQNYIGDGSLGLFAMLDKANAQYGGLPQGTNGVSSADSRYTAATGDQLAIANAVWPDQSVTDLVVVCAPTAQPVDFAITDLGSGNSAANQAAIRTALQDMCTRLSSPAGMWIANAEGAPTGTIYPNQWEEAIAALGLSTFTVQSPTGPISGSVTGAMPTLGAITYAS